MTPENIIIALLSIFPYMSGNNRQCIQRRQEAIAEALHETSGLGVPVEVMTADWSTLRQHAPFSLLFMDAEEGASLTVNEVVDLVAPGGIVVLDDLTPCQSWPPVVDGRVDLVREQWLDDERFVASEVMVAPDASVVIATRR